MQDHFTTEPHVMTGCVYEVIPGVYIVSKEDNYRAPTLVVTGSPEVTSAELDAAVESAGSSFRCVRQLRRAAKQWLKADTVATSPLRREGESRDDAVLRVRAEREAFEKRLSHRRIDEYEAKRVAQMTPADRTRNAIEVEIIRRYVEPMKAELDALKTA